MPDGPDGGLDTWNQPYPSRAVESRCHLCGREVPRRLITLHHLLPRERGGTAEHRVPTCKPCHKTVHATYSNKDLARRFTTIESLREAPELQPFLRWIRKQSPDRNFNVDMAAGHPNQRRRGRRWR